MPTITTYTRHFTCNLTDSSAIKQHIITKRFNNAGLMIRVFTNGPGKRGSISCVVIPKTQKNGT